MYFHVRDKGNENVLGLARGLPVKYSESRRDKVGANNTDSAKLSLEQEVQEIRTQFMFEHGKTNCGDSVIFEHSFFASKNDLAQDLRQHNPHILVFACHAQKNALELFKHELAARDLVKFIDYHLKDPGWNLQLIIRNACNSADIAEMLSKIVDFGIGHHTPVGDEDVVKFSKEMFGYLGAGKNLLLSFTMAKMVSNPYQMIGKKNAANFRLSVPKSCMAAETAPSKAPIVAFLKTKFHESIAERLSTELCLFEQDDLKYVKTRTARQARVA